MSKAYFRKIQDFRAADCEVRLAQYESTRTGLRLYVVNQATPKISGELIVATEIHDDSGSPHTLEHLIFTASRSYPKGLLDRLATRSYGSTNAWTADDMTVYTLDVTGMKGLTNVLPVYLEHLILPKLSDAACYTEVHHIDGTGHDAGVVYSEMQGRENTELDLLDLTSKRQIYPKHVGYHYETGGLTAALRVLTNQRIREFHKAMYQPKNIAVALAGDIDHQELLQCLDEFEDTILDHVPPYNEPFDRPWMRDGKSPPLLHPSREIVEFPESDESLSQLQISYFGPDINDAIQRLALRVFGQYMCGGSAALLDKTLVEDENLASSIYMDEKDRPDSLVQFTLSDVATDDLSAVEKRFFEVLNNASAGPPDMNYLSALLRREVRTFRWTRESSHVSWLSSCELDHVFRKRDGSDFTRLRDLTDFDVIAKWTEQEWQRFFRKWFVDVNAAVTIAKPSKALSERLEQAETARIQQQKEKFGDAGLQHLAKELAEKKADNDKPVPKDLLQQWPIPPADSIRFIETVTAFAGHARQPGSPSQSLQKYIDADDHTTELFLHLEQIKSNFVTVGLAFNTHGIPEQLRPALALFKEVLFVLPIMRADTRVEFEQVIAEIEDDTVDYSDYLYERWGSETLYMYMVVEPEKYAKAIEWFKHILIDTIFDEERLLSCLRKNIAGLAGEKRAGENVVEQMGEYVHTTRQSTAHSQNLFVRNWHLKKIFLEFTQKPKTVVDKLENIRRVVVGSTPNFRCFAAGDFESGKIKNPVSSWTALTTHSANKGDELVSVDKIEPTMSSAGANPGRLAYVMPMRAIDSSFATSYTKAINSFEDPQLPALAVAQAYLEVIEGPLWNAVRGNGLAYGAGFGRSIEQGNLKYDIYRSPDAYKAFEFSKKVVQDLAVEKVELDDLWVEDAIANVISEEASKAATAQRAAMASFRAQTINGISKDWSQRFVKQVQRVKKPEIVLAIRNFVLPLFEPETANVFMTCAPIMESKLIRDFRNAGFKAEVKSWHDFRDDYGLDLGEVEEEETEDEDEDGQGETTDSEGEEDESCQA